MRRSLVALSGILLAVAFSLPAQEPPDGRGNEGKLDDAGRAIELAFNYPNGKFTNRFTFDPESQSWTSLMRQEAKGEWKLFAEDKFTPIASK